MDLANSLNKYAELIVKVGLSLKKGDNLQITFNIWGLELARLVADKAYEAGVGDVILNFTDEHHQLSFYQKARDVTYFPDFKARYMEELAENGYHRCVILAANPSLLKHVDAERITAAQRVRDQKTKKVMEYNMSNFVKWCLVAVPSPGWAAAVFPGALEEEAMEKLWENILKAIRVDQDDPVSAWQEHDRQLKLRQEYLNTARFEKLLYKGPGTDLEVYLPEKHVWRGGSEVSQGGDRFMANIPTEEVFTMPHRDGVNGTLRATMPLAVMGKLVEDLSFVFRDGVITEFRAAKEQAVFEKILDSDEGSRRLGEVALVPHNSPISNTGILFLNTLFDENASCHFAAGAAYPDNLENGESLSEEERKKQGMNDSLIHYDFMVGSREVTVTGVQKDGTEIVLLQDGDWQI